MKIAQSECQSDLVRTDAALRGVKVIDYGQLIQEAKDDLEQLRQMHRKHNLKDSKSVAEMMTRLENMELLAREWISLVGYEHRHSKDYAVTILVEEINKT